MDLPFGFEMAAGSVIGADHLYSGKVLVGRNNQDAVGWHITDKVATAVVCDGCGSGKYSEFGARLLANVIPRWIEQVIREYPECSTYFLFKDVYPRVCSYLNEVWCTLGGMSPNVNGKQILNDYLLCTIVGVVVREHSVIHFSIGDGVTTLPPDDTNPAVVNLRSLGPFPGNMPPYIAYRLTQTGIDPALLEFQTQTFLISEVDVILFGTDGVLDLAAAEHKTLPGQAAITVGPLSRFWTNDLFFENPDALRRRLHQINAGHTGADWMEKRLHRQTGLLPDDTSLVVIRKKRCE